ncbi:MAG: CDP-alcohol phosphatidyltransferase family protein [Thiobacillus sp.]
MNNHADRPFLGAYNSACLLSLAGVTAAVVAMALATSRIIELALVGLILAGLADLFDGVVARRLKRSDYEKEFGVQLDTVVDAVAFVATPVIIALNAAPASLPMLTGMTVFVVAGVVRLAHFNTLSVRCATQSTHHRGLPVTYTALILPLLFLLREQLSSAVFDLLLSLAFALIGVLFVVNFPIRKPRGMFYVIVPVLAAGLIAVWVLRFLRSAGSF